MSTWETPRPLARELAVTAHDGQSDRDGLPHIEHVQRVVRMVAETFRPVAWLHDVPEDSPRWAEDAYAVLDQPEERGALALLTRREGEGYMRYIDRILGDQSGAGTIARIVKEADMVDNLRRCLVSGDGAAHRYRAALCRFWCAP